MKFSHRIQYQNPKLVLVLKLLQKLIRQLNLLCYWYYFHLNDWLFRKVRRELNVDDVTRHLAYAFVGFLQRQKDRDEHKDNEDKQAEFTQAVSIINSLYALPEEQTDEDPLKVSRE